MAVGKVLRKASAGSRAGISSVGQREPAPYRGNSICKGPQV